MSDYLVEEAIEQAAAVEARGAAVQAAAAMLGEHGYRRLDAYGSGDMVELSARFRLLTADIERYVREGKWPG